MCHAHRPTATLAAAAVPRDSGVGAVVGEGACPPLPPPADPPGDAAGGAAGSAPGRAVAADEVRGEGPAQGSVASDVLELAGDGGGPAAWEALVPRAMARGLSEREFREEVERLTVIGAVAPAASGLAANHGVLLALRGAASPTGSGQRGSP